MSATPMPIPGAPDDARAVADLRRAFAPYLERVDLAREQVLFRQGAAGREVFYIESGRLAVVLEIPGHDSTLLRELEPGGVIGEMGLYAGTESRRSATLVAREASVLWKLTPEAVRRMEEEDPRLALRFHRTNARQLGERMSHTTREFREPLAILSGFVRELSESGFHARDEAREALRSLGDSRGDELGRLALSFLGMEATLQRYLGELRLTTAAKERMERELELAAEIQGKFLPGCLEGAEGRGVDLCARLRPARQAAGDLYEHTFLPDGRLLLLIGDVSDKGVPAALFMAAAMTLVRSYAAETRSPARLLARINAGLCRVNATGQFLTAFAAIFDPATGQLRYAGGGHPAPWRRRVGGDWEALPISGGLVLGTFEDADQEYADQVAFLEHGETLLAFTDGVTDEVDGAGLAFGREGLLRCLREAPPEEDASALTGRVLGALQAFRGDRAPADDVTLLALRRS